MGLPKSRSIGELVPRIAPHEPTAHRPQRTDGKERNKPCLSMWCLVTLFDTFDRGKEEPSLGCDMRRARRPRRSARLGRSGEIAAPSRRAPVCRRVRCAGPHIQPGFPRDLGQVYEV